MGIELGTFNGDRDPAEMLASTINREAAQFARDMVREDYPPQFNVALPYRPSDEGSPPADSGNRGVRGWLGRFTGREQLRRSHVEQTIGVWVVRATRYGGGDLEGYCANQDIAHYFSASGAFSRAHHNHDSLEVATSMASRVNIPPEPKELAVSTEGELVIVTAHKHYGHFGPVDKTVASPVGRSQWLNPAAVTTPEQATEIYKEWQTDLRAAANNAATGAADRRWAADYMARHNPGTR
jgi:hypothetical protein